MSEPDPIERPPATRAGLRRACTNCTACKAKCSPLSTNECERCHRLGKACRYGPLATTRKLPEQKSRLRALERKVEELAARQEYPPRGPQGSTPTRLSSDGGGTPNVPDRIPQWPNRVDSPSHSGLAGGTPSGILSSTVSNADGQAGDIVDRGLITQELAQVLLDRFRATAASQFPFVVIPADSSVEAVRSQTGFLFLAIAATMIFDNPLLQHQLGDELRQQAFQRLLLGNERRLDDLQGLLIYTAWCCHFSRPGIRQEFLLAQLCVTLAHDLGLDRSKSRQADRPGQLKPVSNVQPNSSLANAQMRAYLGAYCVSCLVVTVQRTRAALPYTKYMDYCCRLLAECKEYKTDELIPSFVRSQELSRRVSDTFSYDSPEDGEIRGEYLVTLTSDAFIRDLDRLRAEVPTDFQKSILLDLEFKAIFITINEAALHTKFWNSANESPLTPTFASSIGRPKMLWRSLTSCHDLIRTFLSYQNQDLFYITAFVCPRLVYAFITLAKLVALHLENNTASESQPPALDVAGHPCSMAEFVNEVNYQELAKQVLDKFAALSTDFVSVDGRRDSMANAASGMKMMMAGYERQINERQRPLQCAQLSVSAGEALDEHPETVRSSIYTGDHEVGYAESNLDMDFAWGSVGNMFWDDVLESFTIVPYL